ncbi:MAG: DUF5682 family protein [Saprospiraceae bacterium]|nr:DUF5682 family protein [Saprospiraceae bacterium]
MQDSNLRLFGIRHHGAGSARNLVSALEHFRPDILLIECPADAEHLIPFVQEDLLTPPVAILIYNQDCHQQHVYYPFTAFSPEWQALLFANRQKIPVRFFDLPQGQSFHLSDYRITKLDGVIHDPFAFLADAAGMKDSERWWDQYIEQHDHGADVFDTVLELMTEMRNNVSHEYQINEIREAFMRQQIRKARHEGFSNIGVVCGAWHAPVLDPNRFGPEKSDARWLRSLKKVKTKCTWVPWSYHRIARHSGYGSGVISPYWYETLFHHQENATVHWMSRAAHLMHKMAIDVSPSHVIEATRLATSLSALRCQLRPGIEELFEAVTTVFCFGNEALIAQLRTKLLEGEAVGIVSQEIPVVPLLTDLEHRIKQCRLTKVWRSHDPVEKHLDLRKPTQLLASRLLHQLLLLQIPWGSELEPENDPYGTFHEYWDLHWLPDYEMHIIEASMWGNSVKEACLGLVLDTIQNETNLGLLGDMLHQALRGDLPALIKPITQKVTNVANMSQDLQDLMPVVAPLIWSLRYGNTHQMDTSGLADLLDQLLPRICLLLPGRAARVGEELAHDLFAQMIAVDQALKILQHSRFTSLWHEALAKLAIHSHTHPLLKGAAMRELFNIAHPVSKSVKTWLHRELSSLDDPYFPAFILEGFLHGGGSVLLHYANLRQVVDQWMISISDEHFTSFLPILRRVFSRFSKGEKEVLFELINRGDRHITRSELPYDQTRIDILLPVLQKALE